MGELLKLPQVKWKNLRMMYDGTFIVKSVKWVNLKKNVKGEYYVKDYRL